MANRRWQLKLVIPYYGTKTVVSIGPQPPDLWIDKILVNGTVVELFFRFRSWNQKKTVTYELVNFMVQKNFVRDQKFGG